MILKINIILRSPLNVLHSVLVIGRAKRDPPLIGERSEPLSRVFNDPTRGICICYSTVRSDIRDIFHEL